MILKISKLGTLKAAISVISKIIKLLSAKACNKYQIFCLLDLIRLAGWVPLNLQRIFNTLKVYTNMIRSREA